MAQKAPGKHYREGMTLADLFRRFPDDTAAEKWFTDVRWPGGDISCPHCGSVNIQNGTAHKTMPYRCRDCRKWFSVKTGTVMQSSKLGLQVWAIASYLLTTGLKGQASMKLHRDLGITQKTAWHLAHRIRETWAKKQGGEGGGDGSAIPMCGPVEVDETYIGGKRKNMPASKRRTLRGRGAVGKTAVVGGKDRASNRVAARSVENTEGPTLQGFVAEHATPGATVYTDEAAAYQGMSASFEHEAVCHSVGEYVRGQAHTNGMESFWSMLKRGYHGTYHKMSPKHLDRYVTEFSGRHNDRPADTIEQMQHIAQAMVGKRLRYKDLIADNGLSSGARSC